MNNINTEEPLPPLLPLCFEKCFHCYDSKPRVSEINYKLRITATRCTGIDYLPYLSAAIDELVKNTVKDHTEYSGKPALRISFKLVNAGLFDVIKLPYTDITAIAEAIMCSASFYDDFIGFLMNDAFNFELRFRITARPRGPYARRT